MEGPAITGVLIIAESLDKERQLGATLVALWFPLGSVE